jgi:hypothetical protein
MKITLYLKTHNKTGLKYLGKTIQDPFTYLGSGKRWVPHLKKHGTDIKTEILFETEDPKELTKWGIYYSKLWNVVKSKDFANCKEESGDGGDMSMCDAYRKGIIMRDTSGSKNSMYGRSAIVEQNIRWYNNGTDNIYVPAGTEPKEYKPGRIIDYKKPHKASTKALISKENGRACISPIGEVFASRALAAKEYGVSAPAIGGLIARGVSGWRWATRYKD